MRKALFGCVAWLAIAGAASAAETVTAKIITVQGKAVTVSAGESSGIAEGQVFTLYTAGKTIRIPLTDTVTYEEGRPAGQAKAVRVGRTSSVLEITVLEKGVTLGAGMDAVAKIVPQAPAPVPAPAPRPEPEPEPVRPTPGPTLPKAGDFKLRASALSADAGEEVTITAEGHRPGMSYTWRADGGHLDLERTPSPDVTWTAPRRAGEIGLTAVRHAPGGVTGTARLTLKASGTSGSLPARVSIERILGPRRFGEALSATYEIADVTYDLHGYLYILDKKTNRAYALDNHGSCPTTFPKENFGAQVLSSPVAMTTVGDRLYVADAAARMIKVYRAGPGGDAKFLRTVGAGQPLDRIIDIAADPERGTVYALDYDRKCFHVFDADGSYRLNLGRKGSGKGEFLRPAAIECDVLGNVYVLDAGRKNFQVFDKHLAYQGQASVDVAGAGEPVDITVLPGDGTAVVLYGEPSPAVITYGTHGRMLSSSLQKKGLYAGLPAQPVRIAADATGGVCIAPKSRRRLYRWDSKGRPAGILTDVPSGAKSLAVSSTGAFFGLAETAPLVRVWAAGGWLLGGFVDPASETFGAPSLSKAAVSADGRMLYALSPQSFKVLCSTVYGKPVKMMAGKVAAVGASPDKLYGPRDLSTAPGGGAAVLDVHRYRFRTVTFDPAQEAVSEIRLSRGIGLHELIVPWRMAMDPVTGGVYVYDHHPRLIKKYDSRGGFMGAVGGPGTGAGQFSQVERMVVGARGELWIFDAGRGDIQMIDFRGKTARPGFTIKRGQFDADITDIGIDGRGRLYVLTGRDTVYVFRQR